MSRGENRTAEFRASYEADRFRYDPNLGDAYITPRGEVVSLKRLAAVAWFGLDAIRGQKVYSDTFNFDIREDNLTIAASIGEAQNKRRNNDAGA